MADYAWRDKDGNCLNGPDADNAGLGNIGPTISGLAMSAVDRDRAFATNPVNVSGYLVEDSRLLVPGPIRSRD
ncbi:MAG: hypothetical protein K8F25_09135, partial [Fimbriimonadaceae bacterium]|nr:hypothetical protein [Alphaproteobacteria bacterium]